MSSTVISMVLLEVAPLSLGKGWGTHKPGLGRSWGEGTPTQSTPPDRDLAAPTTLVSMGSGPHEHIPSRRLHVVRTQPPHPAGSRESPWEPTEWKEAHTAVGQMGGGNQQDLEKGVQKDVQRDRGDGT